MGVSRSPDELFRKVNTIPSNLRAARTNAVRSGANLVSSICQDVIDKSGAGGPRGAKMRTKNMTQGGQPAVLVYAGPNPGWVAIMNSRTQPHFIARRGGRGRGRLGSLRRQNLESAMGRKSVRAGAMLLQALAAPTGGGTMQGLTRGAINIKGVGPRAWAFHPGTKGHHFIPPAKASSIPRGAVEVQRRLASGSLKAFM